MIGGGTPVYVYNGATWATIDGALAHDEGPNTDPTPFPFGVYRFSCASPSFCGGSALGSGAATYTGGVWGLITNFHDGRNPVDVSCPTDGYCMAPGTDLDGNLNYIEGGSGWSQTHPIPGVPPAVIQGGTAGDIVSCPTKKFCAVVEGVGPFDTQGGIAVGRRT
jgi:hypothetical protein